MKPHPDMTTYFTGQDSFLRNRGDAVWECICDNFLLDRLFRAKDVALVLEREFGWERSTAYQYARVTMIRASMDPDPHIIRVSNKHWKLPSH